ncbi:response regulator [bacterium]|nr:response regulator [bacterium]
MNKNHQSTILIIDDEAIIRNSFADYLEDRDYKTLTAENGRIGIETFQREQPDLVLVDLRMPEVDGLEVLSHIKASSADTPMIVISGTGEIREAAEALRRGAWDYLIKPIESLEILSHAVDNALEKSRLKQENLQYQQSLEKMVSTRTLELELANTHLDDINRRLKRIVESTRSLSYCTEVKQFGTQLLKEFGLHMQATGGSMYMKEKDGLRLVNTLDPGHAQSFIPFPLQKYSIFNRSFIERQPILINDIANCSNLSCSGWKGYKDGSTLVFPLSDLSGDIIGILSLHSKRRPPFVEQDKEIGSILASYSCEAIRAVRATEDLRVSEERFRELAEMLPEAVFESDSYLNLTYANQKAFELFGISEEDFNQGLNGADLLAPEEQKKMGENIKDLLKNRISIAMEFNAMRKDGSTFPILFRTSAILKDEIVTGYRIVVVNIIERKRAEEQIRASLKEKETLLQEIHHRVKNNMAVIVSLLKLQMHRNDDERVKEALKESQNRVYSMSTVHETLFSSNNLSEILVEPFIGKIVEYVFQSFQINQNQIRLKTEFDPIKLTIEKASPLGLVINELVSNALKYAFENGRDGEIVLSIKKLISEDVGVIISDNGIGMPMDMDWTKPKGLGLQLVKNLVENQLDGSLNMESDQGTRFIIRFGI